MTLLARVLLKCFQCKMMYFSHILLPPRQAARWRTGMPRHKYTHPAVTQISLPISAYN